MTINNAVMCGRAKLVMYDLRDDSPTKGELQEVFFGEDNYVLVQMPPGIANGYKAYGDKMVILANCATEPHRPDEIVRLDDGFVRRRHNDRHDFFLESSAGRRRPSCADPD